MVYAFSFGNGSELSPYVVSSPADLNGVRDYPNKYFIQAKNIDMQKIDNFLPLGAKIDSTSPQDNLYRYDGNNHIISNLTINFPDMNGVALFQGNSHVVTNLGLISPYIRGYSAVGAIGGYGYNGGIPFENCFVINPNISAYANCGGIIGRRKSSHISNCFVRGGIIYGESVTGGCFGYIQDGPVIKNCYSSAIVNGPPSSYVGGLYGRRAGAGSVTNCYYEKNSPNNSGGKLPEDMTDINTYIGFDFVNIWGINPAINKGYPYLKSFPAYVFNLDIKPSDTNLYPKIINFTSPNIYPPNYP